MLLSASTAVFANSGYDKLWSYGHPDFKVDSISYRITSDSTCEVTYDSLYVAVNGHCYGMIHMAEISIPAKVINDGKAYAVTGIGRLAFGGCRDIRRISLPASIKYIAEDPFVDTSIDSLALPSSLNSLDFGAISCMPKLKRINLPDAVTKIPMFCFQCDSSLVEVRLGNHIPTMEDGVFSDCVSLVDIYCRYGAPSKCKYIDGDFYPSWHSSADIFRLFNTANCTLHVPTGCSQLYMEDDGWKSFKQIVEYDFPGWSGAEAVNTDDANPRICAYDGKIQVSGNAAEVEVFSISGQLLYHGSDLSIPMPKGFYIVRVGNFSQKVLLR